MDEQRWTDLVAVSVGGPVTLGSMFGSKGLRTGTKFFAIWWHDQLVLKLPRAQLEELIDGGEAEQFEPAPGRPMNGWAVIAPTTDWSALSGEARAFVESQQR